MKLTRKLTDNRKYKKQKNVLQKNFLQYVFLYTRFIYTKKYNYTRQQY